MYSKKQKNITFLAVLLVLLVMSVGCGTSKPATNTGTSGNSPKIKIGMLTPLTGFVAAAGTDMRDGFLMYLKQHDNKLGGMDASVIIEDTASDAGQSVTKAKKLVEQDGVNLILGPLSAAEGNAVAPYIKERKIIDIFTIPTGDNLTQQDRSDYILRTGYSASQPMFALAQYAYDTLGYRKIAIMAMDYTHGWESAGGFQYAFEQKGGQIVKRIWTPVGTKDYGPYLAQIPKDIDAIFTLQGGADGVNFMKAYTSFNLKYPLIGTGASTDESVLPQYPDTSIGYITALHYSAVLNTPENKQFSKDFLDMFGRGAGYYAESGNTAALVIDNVLKALGNKYTDTNQFVQAFRNLKITAPRGPMTFDQYNNPVQNIYIRKVEKVNGKLQNTVIDTIPNVSQFWNLTPEQVLNRPPFSKTYPPLK